MEGEQSDAIIESGTYPDGNYMYSYMPDSNYYIMYSYMHVTKRACSCTFSYTYVASYIYLLIYL